MADYDLKHNIKVLNAITPAVLDADNTEVEIDTDGFKSVTVQTNFGIGGITFSASNKVEFKLTECDTSGGAYTAVAEDDVIMPYGESWASGGIIRSLIAAKAAIDTEVHAVGYRGKKRYLKLLADFTGTHGTGTPMSASMIIGSPMAAPVGQASLET